MNIFLNQREHEKGLISEDCLFYKYAYVHITPSLYMNHDNNHEKGSKGAQEISDACFCLESAPSTNVLPCPPVPILFYWFRIEQPAGNFETWIIFVPNSHHNS